MDMDTRDHPGGPSAVWSGVAASSAPINWSQVGGLELRTAPCFEGLRSLDSGFTYVQERVRVFAKKTRLLICLSRNMSPLFFLPPPPPLSLSLQSALKRCTRDPIERTLLIHALRLRL